MTYSGVTKGQILATSKEKPFHDIRYELGFFKARIIQYPQTKYLFIL